MEIGHEIRIERVVAVIMSLVMTVPSANTYSMLSIC